MKAFDPKEYKREIAVFNLLKGSIMLVFTSGAKVNDTSGLLEGFRLHVPQYRYSLSAQPSTGVPRGQNGDPPNQ